MVLSSSIPPLSPCQLPPGPQAAPQRSLLLQTLLESTSSSGSGANSRLRLLARHHLIHHGFRAAAPQLLSSAVPRCSRLLLRPPSPRQQLVSTLGGLNLWKDCAATPTLATSFLISDKCSVHTPLSASHSPSCHGVCPFSIQG